MAVGDILRVGTNPVIDMDETLADSLVLIQKTAALNVEQGQVYLIKKDAENTFYKRTAGPDAGEILCAIGTEE